MVRERFVLYAAKSDTASVCYLIVTALFSPADIEWWLAEHDIVNTDLDGPPAGGRRMKMDRPVARRADYDDEDDDY